MFRENKCGLTHYLERISRMCAIQYRMNPYAIEAIKQAKAIIKAMTKEEYDVVVGRIKER